MKCFLLFVPLLLVTLVGCGGASSMSAAGTGAAPVSPTQYIVGVDHAYFPITPGTLWIYAGVHEGAPRVEEVRTLAETEMILGIECTAMQEHVFDYGEIVEMTTEYFAQDVLGNVWKFGEESFEFDSGVFTPTTDSWRAGEGGATAWLAFAANPQVGDVHVGFTPVGLDEYHVASITASIVVPAGSFNDCLQIVENPDDPDDTDIILYASGVGRVSEENQGGSIVLVAAGPDPG